MSTESSSASSSISLPSKLGEHYRVLLLNTDEDPNTVLMYFANGEWDLPYFEYSEGSLDGTLIPVVCSDFQTWLGLMDDHVHFSGTVELLGTPCTESKENPKKIGRAQLLLVEVHGIKPAHIDLPQGAQWKNADFFFAPNALPDPEDLVTMIMVQKILNCMEKPSYFLESLSDERYRPGWFENASQFLVESLARDGAQVDSKVIQCHMSCTSTLLRVDTSLGNYFLKSPASGCNEITITTMLAKLFPNVCPSIVGSSKELNCFVSREFDHEEPEAMRDAVLALGQIQLQSIDHIENLEQAGCPVRDLGMLPEHSREWPQRFRDLNGNTLWLNGVLPIIEDLSTELKGFKIPKTLVHGDFSTGNTGFAERNGRRDLILFDWEYAYIGHPFFDFHRVYKQVPKDVREEYLTLWSSFENVGRARRAYNIAKRLGWVMKLWSMLEWASKCNAQHASLLASNTFNLACLCYNLLVPVPEN